MAGITLAQAEAKLAEWLAADTAVSKGQSYTIGGTAFTRAHAQQIRESIAYWNDMCQKLSGETNVARKIRVYGGTPA